jgi:hypothetical protein
VFAASGGIRSTAGDLLTYLDAQLHPGAGTLSAALRDSHRLHTDAGTRMRSALGWVYNPETGVYWANGGTGGFSSHAFFYPKGDYAAIVLLNAAPGPIPIYELVAEHVRQRLAGEPAVSLNTVVVPGTGGATGVVRSFASYWITMLAAGAFVYCCLLSLQGMAAQLLPRRGFLRVVVLSAVGDILCPGDRLLPAAFAAVCAGGGPAQPLLAWIPSYWFVGLFQQLNGSLHPALAPLAQRAWAGLGIAGGITALAYTLSYLRTMRQIIEEPDIVPGIRGAGVAALVRRRVRNGGRAIQHSHTAAQPAASDDPGVLPGSGLRSHDPAAEDSHGAGAHGGFVRPVA